MIDFPLTRIALATGVELDVAIAGPADAPPLIDDPGADGHIGFADIAVAEGEREIGNPGFLQEPARLGSRASISPP